MLVSNYILLTLLLFIIMFCLYVLISLFFSFVQVIDQRWCAAEFNDLARLFLEEWSQLPRELRGLSLGAPKARVERRVTPRVQRRVVAGVEGRVDCHSL